MPYTLIAASANEIASYFGIPTGIAGIGIPLYLLLKRVVVMATDADKRVEEVKASEQMRRELQDASYQLQISSLTHRIDVMTGDRDAWKRAHHEESERAAAAERATAALLETSDLSNKLLDALREQLSKGQS